MKVAAAQIACSLGDPDANLRKMCDYCRQAKQDGVELIVFPELADTGYSMPMIEKIAQPWNAGVVPALRKTANELSIAIIAGVSERDGGVVYNSQVFIDQQGNIAGKYRKTHLFTGATMGEDKCFTAGKELTSISFDRFRLGLTICYDLRFPEIYRVLAIEGKTNVFILSAAWPFPRLEHLRMLAVARAIENQSYMVVSNRVGTDEGVTCCGLSAVIDPYGVTIASASTDREELVMANLSEEIICSVRKKMAVFEQRRPELYR